MSIQFNVCLFLWTKYTKEECQPAPFHIFNFLRKLSSDTCPLFKDISQGNTLHWPFSIKLLCFLMSKKFNVSLFLWPKYTKKEHQPFPWLILNFLRKLWSETFISTMTFHKETHYIGHCLASYSASICPISSMFVCFYGLSIPRKSASLFLSFY